MTISHEQRRRNTWNKLEAQRKNVSDDTPTARLYSSNQGRKGRDLVTAERINSGSAGGDEILEDHEPSDARAIARDSEKLINKHLREGKKYGAGHDMRKHGEGKSYGDK